MFQNSPRLFEAASIGFVRQIDPDDGAVTEGIGIFELVRIVLDDLGATDDGLGGQFHSPFLNSPAEFLFGNAGDSAGAVFIL